MRRLRLDQRTDVFNFGATMYWVLTRQPIPTALSQGEGLMNSKDDQFIERPKPAIDLNPRIPQRLNDLIMQCVEVDADKRPPSMHAVADRLNLILGILRARTETGSGERSHLVASTIDDEDDAAFDDDAPGDAPPRVPDSDDDE